MRKSETSNDLSEQQVGQYWVDGVLYPIDVTPERATQTCRHEREANKTQWKQTDLPLSSDKNVNVDCALPMACQPAADHGVFVALAPPTHPFSADCPAFFDETRTKQVKPRMQGAYAK